MSQDQHYSVLLQESVEALIHDANGVYIDGTFGRGGHSREILKRLSDQGRLLGFDKDTQAVDEGLKLAKSDARFSMVHASFAELEREMASRDRQADGLLLDLGVSSPQLDEAERGFSFMRNGPLDMRMDTSSGISAAQWLAQTSMDEMAKVFWRYGEERFARRIAKEVVLRREQGAIKTTYELVELIESCIPKKDIHKHPATRVFQAIRIEINNELGDLEKVLQASLEVLKPGARIVVISFHSLEDRIVKRFFKKYSQSQRYPQGVPVTHDMLSAPLKLIGRAVKASETEISENVRSRSAILRIAQLERGL